MRTDSIPTIGVVVALPAEARVLTRMADKMMQGLPAKGKIVVRQSGIGLQAARRQAEYLADISELLVSFGVSGGLHPALKTGDLILADRVLTWDPDLHELSQTQALPLSFRADAGLIDYIAKHYPLLSRPHTLFTQTDFNRSLKAECSSTDRRIGSGHGEQSNLRSCRRSRTTFFLSAGRMRSGRSDCG